MANATISDPVSEEEKEHIISIMEGSVQSFRENQQKNNDLADELEEKVGELLSAWQ